MISMRTNLITLVCTTVFVTSVSPCNSQYQSYGYQNNTGAFGRNSYNTSFNGGFSCLNTQQQSLPQCAGRRTGQSNSHSTMSDLERTLDAVDNSNSWARTPVSGAMPANVAPSNRYPATFGTTYARQGNTQRSYPLRTVSAPPRGGTANAMSGMFPTVSRQEMLRIFMEGGTPSNAVNQGYQGYNPQTQNSSSNTTNVYYNYQTAENEATKSRNYSNTARYDKDKWNRKNAASQAEYAANNAEYAAQRAESGAYNGDAKAKSYASLARQAANRARYNANQARYNANTIQ